MKNFDLKKYLAENKLLNEQLPDTSLTNALKIHFQVAYEKGLEAQPGDDYDSFDEKYWKNNELDIKDTIRKYYRFPMKEEVNEELDENKLLNESIELTPIERRKLIYFLEMKVEEMQNKGDNFFSDEIEIFNSILNKIR